MVMTHDADPKELLKKELGNISEVEIFNTQILCVVYIRPQKTKSGIYLPDSTVDEDRHQSKVGLVVKMGADAFIDDTGKWFKDAKIELDDWVVFRPSDGWSITVNGVLCRILDDTNVRGRIQQPDTVW
jgi:co-chaperonin GroES (HSP10)